jgi:hypothetical protein
MSQPTMTMAQMQAKIAELEAANQALKAHTAQKITLKVAKKGGLSVYGLQRFPVTLFAETWKTLFTMAPDVAKFIAANPTLSRGKDDARYLPGGEFYTPDAAE